MLAMNAPPVRRWLVEAAQRIDAALGPARVARLVLPPLLSNPGKEGQFCAAQLDDGSVGLAFTLLDGTRAAGLAAINALARRLYARTMARRRGGGDRRPIGRLPARSPLRRGRLLGRHRVGKRS
jgi:hypothetical protein